MTVIETPLFVRYAAEVWDDDDRDAFTNQDELVLLLAYAKAKFDNLSSDYLRRLKETIDGS